MVEKYRYVILGAGPAGLSFANYLQKHGEKNFIVIEKETEAGGLCRSVTVDGAPVDIAGGHFLDVRRPEVNDFLFQFMPESEWNVYDRDSRIEVDGMVIGHPFEANIWQMPQKMQVAYLKSIAVAGCNLDVTEPEKFVDWIRWKLGDLIADKYMFPYNIKMFGDNLDKLGTYWLEKLPNVSFEETLLSCLNRKAYGTEPGHTQFYYPKEFGYGELWLRMAEAIREHIWYNLSVQNIDFQNRRVRLSDKTEYQAENIILTIPWTSIPELLNMPVELMEDIKKLKHTSVNITYIPEELETEAQWIYYPDLSIDYHRILVRRNFYNNAKGYWTETNSDRYHDEGNQTFKSEYAYPLNTLEKPELMKRLLTWAKKQGVYGLGRWGEWEHYNSDVTVGRALKLAKSFLN